MKIFIFAIIILIAKSLFLNRANAFSQFQSDFAIPNFTSANHHVQNAFLKKNPSPKNVVNDLVQKRDLFSKPSFCSSNARNNARPVRDTQKPPVKIHDLKKSSKEIFQFVGNSPNFTPVRKKKEPLYCAEIAPLTFDLWRSVGWIWVGRFTLDFGPKLCIG